MISFDFASIGYKDGINCYMPRIMLPDKGIVAIIGKNGVGKTTLFKTLTKEIRPLLGNISYNHVNLKDIEVRNLARMQSYIPQKLIENSTMSVLSWLLLGFAPQHGAFDTPDKKDIDQAYHVSGSLGITPLLERQISSLSGGELQRAAIARAILQDTSTWLLDEFFGQVDLDSAIELRRLLVQHSKHKLILLSTHSIQTAKQLATKVLAFLPTGRVLYLEPEGITNAVLSTIYGTSFQEIHRKCNGIDGGTWITH